MSKKVTLLFKSFPWHLSIRFLFLYLLKRIIGIPAALSFSQTGEDMILKTILGNKEDFFYVDVGCNHPIIKSNTLWMYLLGGSGICIDANKTLVDKYRKYRKRDRVVHAAVSDVEEKTTFYISDRDALSTLDKNAIESWGNKWKFWEKIDLNTQTLTKILDQYITSSTKIDVLSIDVEGHDYEVVKSLDLNKYRPQLIVVEVHGFSINSRQSGENELVDHLSLSGYQMLFYATVNCYFVDTNSDFGKKMLNN